MLTFLEWVKAKQFGGSGSGDTDRESDKHPGDPRWGSGLRPVNLKKDRSDRSDTGRRGFNKIPPAHESRIPEDPANIPVDPKGPPKQPFKRAPNSGKVIPARGVRPK